MAKKATETPESAHRDADRTVKAIKPDAFTKLRDRVTALDASRQRDGEKKAEMMADAVEVGLHSAAFRLFMKLRKMDAVKRNEFLFHFELYCEWDNFAREELHLGDREPSREKDQDGEDDPRPRHLRQPGASAAGAVQELAEKSGATVHPIDQVGRGKPKGDDKPKLN